MSLEKTRLKAVFASRSKGFLGICQTFVPGKVFFFCPPAAVRDKINMKHCFHSPVYIHNGHLLENNAGRHLILSVQLIGW